MNDKEERSPMCAGDSRPGNKPYYINPNCPKCSTSLVLMDLLERPDTPEEEIWHDEFTCPVCRGGIYMDWPEGYEEGPD